MPHDAPVRWVVVNQTQLPSYQRMIEELTGDFGPCLLLTGNPMPNSNPRLIVRKGPPYERRTVRSRIVTWARFMAWAARELALVPSAELLLVTTNPPFLPLLGQAFGALRGVPSVVVILDVYPDHLVELGVAGDRAAVVRAWRALSRRALRSAAAVVTLGDRMAERLRAQAGADLAVNVVPIAADRSLGRVAKGENPFARAHGQVAKCTVLYSGNLGRTHGVGVIAEAAWQLRSRDDVHFLVIGEGEGRRVIAVEKERLGLSNLTLLDAVPWDVLPLSLATADIALVLQGEGSEHLSLPSKTQTMLAVGAAICAVTGPGSDLAALVRDHRVGTVTASGDGAALAKAISSLVDDPEGRAAMRERAAEVARRVYGEDVVTAAYRRILGRALEAPVRRA